MPPVFSSPLRWLAPLLWMALIFAGSSDALSAPHTSRFVEPFLRWLFHDTLSAQTIENLHFLIRKTGHLTEYAVLGALFWWALPPSAAPLQPDNTSIAAVRADRWRAILALLLAACFAASDEFHQSFVPSRGASVHDVLIDTVGAAIGLILLISANLLKPGRAMPRRSRDKS